MLEGVQTRGSICLPKPVLPLDSSLPVQKAQMPPSSPLPVHKAQTPLRPPLPVHKASTPSCFRNLGPLDPPPVLEPLSKPGALSFLLPVGLRAQAGFLSGFRFPLCVYAGACPGSSERDRSPYPSRPPLAQRPCTPAAWLSGTSPQPRGGPHLSTLLPGKPGPSALTHHPDNLPACQFQRMCLRESFTAPHSP